MIRLSRIAAPAIPLLAVAIGACSDVTHVETFPLQVQVLFPATYAQQNASGARVILRNTERGTADTAVTDAQGLATFPRVVPGGYGLAASRSLSADEALTLAGQRTAVELNAVLASQLITTAPTAATTLRLAGAPLGGLVFAQVYYAGSTRPSGGTYFNDQFYEIYNNSTDTIHVDSLYIADAYGNSGQINPTSLPTPFQADQDNVYVSNVWMIPGRGKDHPLAPGQSIVIAQSGLNHRDDPNGNPNSPVDLSHADWEAYNQRDDQRQVKSPTVPSMERVYFTGGFYWLTPVFGPGMVIFRAKDFNSLEQVPIPGASASTPPRIKIPNTLIIDAFEALQNGSSGTYKRIPAALDAGFVFASGTYTGEGFRRKVARTIGSRRVLQNTHNSGNDFELVKQPVVRGF